MLRTLLASLSLLLGVLVLVIATIGVYRMQHPLNRIHVASKCDTLGTILILTGLALFMGVHIATVKLLLILAFMWMTSPVSGHMLGNAQLGYELDDPENERGLGNVNF
ncbi:MAG: monovalent cation/H(+) antiporter subunit G [Angelakisella sp.]